MIAAEGLAVQTAVRVLGVSDSGYYEWLSRVDPVPPACLAVRADHAVHTAYRGAYGARRVHAELVLGHGLVLGNGTIELLMRRAQIKGLPGSRRSRPKHPTGRRFFARSRSISDFCT